MNRKNKVVSKPVEAAIKNDKRPQPKPSKKMQQVVRSQVTEHFNKLKEINEDLVEIIRNVKQTQSQLHQLEETNGKNKEKKMTTAQNNLKNLKKRQVELEKQVKGILKKVRGIEEGIDLEVKCKDLVAVLDILTANSKKKKEEKVGEMSENHEKNDEPQFKDSEPEKPKVEDRSYSLFGETPHVGATFSMPPHFSEFNKSPGKESPERRREQIINTLRSSIEAFSLQQKRNTPPPSLYDRFPMPQPSSCLVKNEKGIYTVRKSSEFSKFLLPSLPPQPSFYSSNLVYESAVNRQPSQYYHNNPLHIRDREIDPFRCWKPPQSSPFNVSKPSGF